MSKVKWYNQKLDYLILPEVEIVQKIQKFIWEDPRAPLPKGITTTESPLGGLVAVPIDGEIFPPERGWTYKMLVDSFAIAIQDLEGLTKNKSEFQSRFKKALYNINQMTVDELLNKTSPLERLLITFQVIAAYILV